MSKGRDAKTESYDTDTFEDPTQSKEESQKQGIVHWPGKEAMESDMPDQSKDSNA